MQRNDQEYQNSCGLEESQSIRNKWVPKGWHSVAVSSQFKAFICWEFPMSCAEFRVVHWRYRKWSRTPFMTTYYNQSFPSQQFKLLVKFKTCC
jgi:hypothetical protein